MPPVLSKIHWKKNYSVNVKIIDDQHKRLTRIINDLIDCVNSKASQEKIDPIIADLVNYKNVHFRTEDDYLKDFGFKGAKAHIKLHEEFSEELMKIENKYSNDAHLFAVKLIELLNNWFINHVLEMDKKFTKCFNKNGLF